MCSTSEGRGDEEVRVAKGRVMRTHHREIRPEFQSILILILFRGKPTDQEQGPGLNGTGAVVTDQFLFYSHL